MDLLDIKLSRIILIFIVVLSKPLLCNSSEAPLIHAASCGPCVTSKCRVVTGVYTSTGQSLGLHPVITLPPGACNLSVYHLNQSNNKIALQRFNCFTDNLSEFHKHQQYNKYLIHVQQQQQTQQHQQQPHQLQQQKLKQQHIQHEQQQTETQQQLQEQSYSNSQHLSLEGRMETGGGVWKPRGTGGGVAGLSGLDERRDEGWTAYIRVKGRLECRAQILVNLVEENRGIAYSYVLSSSHDNKHHHQRHHHRYRRHVNRNTSKLTHQNSIRNNSVDGTGVDNNVNSGKSNNSRHINTSDKNDVTFTDLPKEIQDVKSSEIIRSKSDLYYNTTQNDGLNYMNHTKLHHYRNHNKHGHNYGHNDHHHRHHRRHSDKFQIENLESELKLKEHQEEGMQSDQPYRQPYNKGYPDRHSEEHEHRKRRYEEEMERHRRDRERYEAGMQRYQREKEQYERELKRREEERERHERERERHEREREQEYQREKKRRDRERERLERERERQERERREEEIERLRQQRQRLHEQQQQDEKRRQQLSNEYRQREQATQQPNEQQNKQSSTQLHQQQQQQQYQQQQQQQSHDEYRYNIEQRLYNNQHLNSSSLASQQISPPITGGVSSVKPSIRNEFSPIKPVSNRDNGSLYVSPQHHPSPLLSNLSTYSYRYDQYARLRPVFNAQGSQFNPHRQPVPGNGSVVLQNRAGGVVSERDRTVSESQSSRRPIPGPNLSARLAPPTLQNPDFYSPMSQDQNLTPLGHVGSQSLQSPLVGPQPHMSAQSPSGPQPQLGSQHHMGPQPHIISKHHYYAALNLASADQSVYDPSHSPEGYSAYVTDTRQYIWKISGFSPCSVTCGGGTQQGVVVCVRVSGVLVTVTDNNCAGQRRPEVQPMSCNTEPCPPSWEGTEWSPCSTSCDAGTQTRTVRCTQRISSEKIFPVTGSRCHHLPRLETTRSCNVEVPCVRWRLGDWNKCSVVCGVGSRTREVVCENSLGRPIPENLCPGVKPPLSETCDMGPCGQSAWYHSEWSEQCSGSCGEGFHTRTILCASSSSSSSLSSSCPESSRPKDKKPCRNDVPCGGLWFTGPWGQCSVTCGVGVIKRDVTCIKKLGHALVIVSDDNCATNEKPEIEMSCESPPCVPQWFTTEWSQCSRSCDTGVRTRVVKCLASQGQTEVQGYRRGQGHIEQICEGVRPAHRQPCNTHACASYTHINTDSARCTDEVKNCRMVVQARLCGYTHYQKVCCFSCSSANH